MTVYDSGMPSDMPSDAQECHQMPRNAIKSIHGIKLSFSAGGYAGYPGF